jgi:Domain of unknown function (DUF4282)
VAPGAQEAPLTEQGPGQGWPGQAAGQGRAKPPPPDATAQYAQPQPGPPPGQAPPPQQPPGEARTATQGFINSLFDFSFTSFVTPKVIRVLYALIMIGVGLGVIFFVILAFRLNAALGAITLLILGPVYFLVTMAFYRLVLEFFMVTFRIYEELHLIRRRGDPLP